MNELTPAERTRAEELAKSLGFAVEKVATAMKQKKRIAKLMAEYDYTEPSAILHIIAEDCIYLSRE